MSDNSFSNNRFSNRLSLLCHEKKSCIFLGLDPITENIPHCFFPKKKAFQADSKADFQADSQADLWREYCHFALNTLQPFVVGIKLQSAYFEMLGPSGIALMHDLAVSAKKKGLLVIFDGKRADIPDTSSAYAKTYLGDISKGKDEGYWADNIDAMTVHSFFGTDTVVPFLKTAATLGKMIFICLKTSNQGSDMLQKLTFKRDPFYLFLAKNLANIANQFSLPQSVCESLGFVVGANFPKEAQLLRNIFPKSPFLVPGFGAQGADEQFYGAFHFVDGSSKSGEKAKSDEKAKSGDLKKKKTSAESPSAKSSQESTQKSIYRGAIYPLSRALLYPWLYSHQNHQNQKNKHFDLKNANKTEVGDFLAETAKNYVSRLSL